ncbi:MAG: hypothetical protein IJD39_10350 [Clostridia bacterium]|nr:hypothetical protein [Clostridia bacterium]
MAIAKVSIFSESLGFCTSCWVILPQRKDMQPGQKVPVLWLIHGHSGNAFDWVRKTNIDRYAADAGIAVVMPSAFNSAYTDMAHGPKYFTYIADELPKKLQKMFNFSARREDNFIAGLSMGGAGSMKIGLSRPEQYAAICCLSAGAINRGGVSSRDPRRVLIYGDSPIDHTHHDPYFLAREILKDGRPCPRIFHCCGSEDFLLKSAHETRDFFQALPGNPFQYEYLEAPGAHTWKFWDEHIQDFIRFLALPAPSAEYIG